MQAVLSTSRSNYFSPLLLRSSFSSSDVVSSKYSVRFDRFPIFYDCPWSVEDCVDTEIFSPDDDSDYAYDPVTIHASSFSPAPFLDSARSQSPVSDVSFDDKLALLSEWKRDPTPDFVSASNCTSRDSTPILPFLPTLIESPFSSNEKTAAKTLLEKSETTRRWKGAKKIIIGTGANQLDIPVRLQDLSPTGKTIRATALLDSGCTSSIIDEAFVRKHNLPTWPLDKPIPAVNADGTKNAAGPITRVTELRVSVGDHTEKLMFAIVRLDGHSLYLGFSWLDFHNPEIDWTRRTLHFTRCPKSCKYHTRTDNPEDDEDEVERRRGAEKVEEEREETGEDQLETGDRVFMFDEESYQRTVRQQDEDVGSRSNFAKELAASLPKEIRDYWSVFGEPGYNERLPDRRPWDHAIELTPGFNPTKAKLYPVPKSQQQELDDFLEENLRNGQIRESKSPMSSPFFFIKKSDGSLRPVQDYRKLNEM